MKRVSIQTHLSMAELLQVRICSYPPHNSHTRSIPLAVLSKAYVCSRLIAGIAGSNPFDSMDDRR
jgi:hypothetical protein